MGVGIGELAVDGLASADSHADYALDEARNHPALLQLNFHGIAAATTDGLAAIDVDAAEAEHRYIAAGRRAALYGHQGGQLLARLLDQFIDAGWIEADCLGFSL